MKIVMLTYGDANRPDCWSNVPYLLLNSFKKNNDIKIVSYNIETKQNIATYFYSFIFLLFKRDSIYYFVRSKVNYNIVMRKIKKIIEKEDNDTDLYLLLSYDYDITKFTNKKVMLLHDWNMDYHIEKRLKRDIYCIEKNSLLRTEKTIKNANYVVSLVEDFKLYAEKKYNRVIHYFGMPINAFYNNKDFKNFKIRKYITFIGKKSYIESAKKIISSYTNLSLTNYELHIIGMEQKDFSIKSIDNNIFFHGYLNKGIKEQLDLYYDIIKKSRVIINTNDSWSGMSSLVEALYYYVPIIVSKNNETLKKFGEDKEFVIYANNDENEIKKALKKVTTYDDKKYEEICISANKFVEDDDYDNYIKKIINLVEEE